MLAPPAAAAMSQPPTDEPWGARVVQVIDSGAGLLVNLDAPAQTTRCSSSYRLLTLSSRARRLAPSWSSTLPIPTSSRGRPSSP